MSTAPPPASSIPFGGKAASIDEIPSLLVNADIIISSTGASGYVINRETVKTVMKKRGNRAIFLIDIAVPRDIDPEINRLANAYVYDIDDLKGVIDENMETRSREALKGERIVEESAIKFKKWLDSLEIVPTIVAVKKKIEEITEAELTRTLQSLKDLDQDEIDALQRMTHAIAGKILHNPVKFLKMASHRGSESLYIGMARMLFNLDEEETGQQNKPEIDPCSFKAAK